MKIFRLLSFDSDAKRYDVSEYCLIPLRILWEFYGLPIPLASHL